MASSHVTASLPVVFMVTCVLSSSPVVCQDSVTETSPNTTCPQDVSRRAQGCVQHLGILSTLLMSVRNADYVPTFCGTEKEAVGCLEDKLDLCADSPSRLALLKLQFDPWRSHDGLRYFCGNRHVLREEFNCTSYHELSTCTQRVATKLKDALKFTTQIKPVLDTQCLYNDDLQQCLTGITEQRCNGTRQLYSRLVHALRYPYCDLTDLQQHVRLHAALTLPEDKDGSRSHSSGNGSAAPDNGSASNALARICVFAMTSLPWFVRGFSHR